ncbi:hypothetical protein ABN028_34800 [Actinopolymorpha sp. B17G11]|uniref:hypothetical protein n=1 Tax=Actinopolymorpha sp. B17G11 TaxID=3160861 RepID=UPI0032E473FB
MSFDVFFQGFDDGDDGSGGDDLMRQILEPHIVRKDPAHDFAYVEYGDGDAEVYIGDGRMMATHVSGTDPWHLLVEGARAAGWVILPVGCATCLTDEAQRPHLPDELRADAVLVATGEDLLSVIRSS